MNHIEAALFDLDGTLYIGDKLVDGADRVIEDISKLNKRIAFLTNNSTKTRKEILEKLNRFGIDAKLEDVYTSASVTAEYLARNRITRVYCLGEEALKQELELRHVTVATDGSANCVVIGMTHEIRQEALDIIRSISECSGSLVVACNMDMAYPDGVKSEASGCGKVVTLVEETISRKVDLIVGKPSRFMLERFVEDTGIAYENIMIIGDSYASDVEIAKRNGCMPVLFNQYVSKHEDCLVIESLEELPKLFFDREK